MSTTRPAQGEPPTQPPTQPPRLPVRPRGRGHNTRWGIVILCFFGITINYVDRANLSVALPRMSQDLHIPPEVQGFVLSSFFITYALCQLPAGGLTDKYGVRPMFAIGASIWGLFTMLGAAVQSIGTLIATRLGLGVGEAAGYLGSAKAVSRWFPRHERALANSIWDNGARAGTAIALPVVTAIIALLSWRWSFLITGALAFVWVFAWLRGYREPADHPKLSREEYEYIKAGGARLDDARDESAGPKVRWRQLFGYRTVWAMMVGFFCLNYAIYFFITWFPTYLVKERGFDLLKLGIFGALPGIIAIGGSLLGGFTSDRLVRRGWSINRARKTCLACGMLVSSVIALAVLVPQAWQALALLSVSYASLAFSAASVATLPSDVAPQADQVSSLAGIQNFASNVAGVLGPIVTGFLIGATGSFVVALLLSGALCILGAITYTFGIKQVAPLPARAAATAGATA
ncbi:MAG TPA: MFS transporter [Pseudonocardia sp.]|nr:MFS transporter [Pseudonocardia sp.]